MATYARGNARRRRKNAPPQDYVGLTLLLMLAGVAFYVGMLSGMHATVNTKSCEQGVASKLVSEKRGLTPEEKERVERTVKERVQSTLGRRKSGGAKEGKERFGRAMKDIAVGMSKTTRQDFLSHYDYGIPELHTPTRGTEDALILYQHVSTLPNDKERAQAARYDDGNGIPMLGASDATANCDVLNVISTHSGSSRQCFAIVDNYESYHLQRWMRIGEPGANQKEGINRNLPLRHVSRGLIPKGVESFLPPSTKVIKNHWERLKLYLENFDDVMAEVKTLAKSVVRDNTVVIMVCNYGQVSLLMNFVCSATAQNIDLGNVLVFATDEETLQVARKLGLTAFYDKINFSSVPTEEAKAYGDQTFVDMMYAKVMAVQLVNVVEYDILFQDVDIVWKEDPLEFFHDKSSPLYNFDILFQDDGARSARYAPFAANSGFYYLRHNARTRYLMTRLLYQGDLIQSTKSHQQALAALLAEHSSLYGLKVKILNGEQFPGGFHFHRDHQLMHDIIEGKKTPKIFHMSWTENKKNKVLFFQQMGMWYPNEQCVKDGTVVKGLDIFHTEYKDKCCRKEAKVVCHFRDKPSAIPCNNSPALDKNGISFWSE